MSTIARCRTVVGSLYGLLRNRLGINVATSLEAQELSCTVAPARRLVVLGHEPIAGFARDHGTVADEAAMLALHTLDSTTLIAEPRFVAPGDSVLRTDDPGWRWHCIAGHGTTLSDWERRPLSSKIAAIEVELGTKIGSAVLDGYYTSSEVDDLLAGKQASLANAAALGRISADPGGAPKWDGGGWPGGGESLPLTLPECLAELDVLAYYTADYGVLDASGVPCSVAGDGVAEWQDRSGHGYHLTPTDSSHRPEWQPAVVGTTPVIRFGAVTQSNLRSASLAVPAREHTIVVVARATSPTQKYGRLAVIGLPTSGHDYDSEASAELEARNADGYAAVYNARQSVNTGTALSASQVGGQQLPWGRYALRVARGNVHLSVDGTQWSGGMTPNYGTYTGFALGCYWTDGAPYSDTLAQLVGDELAVAVFARGLTDWELGWLHRALYETYGI